MIDSGLDKKTMIVTGANHGVGAAIAVAFAQQGARVLITYLRQSPELYGETQASAEQATIPGRAYYCREISVRMALGARPKDVAWPVIRNALLLAGFGLIVGIPVALVSVRVLRSVLFGVNPYDPVSIVFSLLLVLSVAALAAWFPAGRAARIDPMEALRYE